MSFAHRLVRSPVVHFAVLGAILFAARTFTASEDDEAPGQRDTRIVLSAQEVRTLEEGFVERWGRKPNEAQRRALIDQAALDEMLYREARFLALDLEDGSVHRRLIEKMHTVSERPGRPNEELVREATALGLDDDVVIRRLLAEKMRMLLQQAPGGTPVRDSDLQQALERRRAELAQPERVTLTQVYLGADARGDLVQSDAEHLLASLRSRDHTAEQAAALSDPFPIGAQLRAYSRLQLQGRFGKSFADRVFALPTGIWSSPIDSPYGVHLVRIEERMPARLPPIEELRATLTQAVLRERARESLARGLAHLRTLYEIEIADTDHL